MNYYLNLFIFEIMVFIYLFILDLIAEKILQVLSRPRTNPENSSSSLSAFFNQYQLPQTVGTINPTYNEKSLLFLINL